MAWYDADRYPLETFAAKSIDKAIEESAEAVMAIIAARTSIYLRDLVEEIGYLRGDMVGIAPAITNKVVTTGGYTPPAVDAETIVNLTRAITDLQRTIFEASPEKRGLVYQADKPLEVPE